LGAWIKSVPDPVNGQWNWLSDKEVCAIARQSGAHFDRHCVGPTWTGLGERNIPWHPTPKPVWLMREIVSASVPPGGSVLDPFAGSGATGVAVLRERCGRTFHGIEIDSTWALRARMRLADVNTDLFADGAA
jgi:site-specific DNA-methyltransferase (adenine-specific)